MSAAEPSAQREPIAQPRPVAIEQRIESKGGGLRVRVLDREGRAVPSARVVLLVSSWPLVGTAREADAQGEVELDAGELEGKTFLAADRTGLGGSGLVRIPREASELELVLRSLAVVQGSVLEADGRSASRAEVIVTSKSMLGAPFPRPVASQIVESGDRFRFELDATGATFEIFARMPSGSAARASVRPDPGGIYEITLQALAITGVVIDPNGAPVADAAVYARRRAGRDPSDDGMPVMTDAVGHFAWPTRMAGEYDVYAVAKQWAASEPVSVNAPAAGEVDPVVVQLLAQSSISGTLLWSSGEPILNAVVAATSDAPRGSIAHDSYGFFGVATGKTDERGDFTIDGLRPGPDTYTLRSAPDPAHPRCVAILEGVSAGSSGARFVIDRATFCGVRVRGTYRLEDGAKREGSCRVELFERFEDNWAWTRPVMSADERFELEGLTPGHQYCLTISNQRDYMPVLVEPWTATDADLELSLVMLRPRTIAIAVVGADGAPAARVRVNFEPEHELMGMRGFLDRPTENDGKVTFYLWPGRYRAKAEGPNGWSEPVDLTIRDRNAPITITLP